MVVIYFKTEVTLITKGRMKRSGTLLLFLTICVNSFCQSSQEVEMADVLRSNGKIYTVVAGLVIILTAVIFLLIRVDRKIDRHDKQRSRNA